MIKKILIFVLLLPSFLFAETSGDDATLDIFSIKVVIPPMKRDFDGVAIYMPQCVKNKASKKWCNKVNKILKKALTITAYFKILDPGSFIANPENETLENTKWEDWFNVGAKFLIKGFFNKKTLHLKLYNIYEKGAFKFKSEIISLKSNKTFLKQIHNFLNDVVLATTGKKGLFNTKILFVSRFFNKDHKIAKSILVMYPDGTGQKVIVGNGTLNLFPSFTPWGDVIYTSYIYGTADLFIGKKKINKDDCEYRSAVFSPDGTKIAAAIHCGSQSDIYLLTPKGKIIKNLTKSFADEVSPSWSKDGSMIAYVSDKPGNPQIYVMNADGSGQRRITFAGANNTTPDFGPNNLIAFTGYDEGHSDIFTVDLSGNILRLTQNQGWNKEPSWSPDGQYIVFISNRGGASNVWIMTQDGRYQFKITEKGGNYSTPFWEKKIK